MERIARRVPYGDKTCTLLYQPAPRPLSAADTGFLHRHAVTEMHLILSGEGRFCTENETLAVAGGDCILVAPGVEHMMQSGAGAPLLRFEMALDAGPAEKPGGLLPDILGGRPVAIWSRCEAMQALVERLYQEQREKRTGFEQNIQAYLALLLTELLRRSQVDERTASGNDAENSMDVKAFTVMDSFFSENYSGPSGPDDLARQLHVSRRQLQRLMRRYMGVSFRQKKTQVRLEVAKSLLRGTTLTLDRIAERVGYGYASSLSKAFLSAYGVSPQDYREKCRSRQADAD